MSDIKEIKISLHSKETGEIISLAEGPEENLFPLDGRLGYINGHINSNDYYVVNGKAINRPNNECYIENGSLLGMKVNSQVIIDDITYETDSSEVELEFDQPGTYKILVKCWPYRDKEIIYENQA